MLVRPPFPRMGGSCLSGADCLVRTGRRREAVGRVFAKQEHPANETAKYIPAYIVHDDQGGPYGWLPTGSHGSKEFSFTNDTIKRETATGIVELIRDRYHRSASYSN